MSWTPADERRVNRNPRNGQFRGHGGLSNGQSAFARRVVGALVQPSAEVWAWEQWRDSPDYGTLERHFQARDRLVEERMRQLLRPSEFRAWMDQRVRREMERARTRQEYREREQGRRQHRTYRERQDRGQRMADEQIRTVRKGNPVRVKVERPGLTGLPYRRLVPTRFQPGRWGVFVDG